jgi:hypothetical protein
MAASLAVSTVGYEHEHEHEHGRREHGEDIADWEDLVHAAG